MVIMLLYNNSGTETIMNFFGFGFSSVLRKQKYFGSGFGIRILDKTKILCSFSNKIDFQQVPIKSAHDLKK